MQSSGSKPRNRLRPTFSAARASRTSESTSEVVYELKCQREHARVNKQYRHAQVLENELNLLKHVHEDRRLQELAEQQAGELSACDAEYCQAYQRLAGTWTAKLRDLQQQLHVAEQQLLIRQENEAAALMVAQSAVPSRPKFSPALLNMRHVERSLALQKEFDKADKVRQQADQLETMELGQIECDRAAKMEIEKTHLATRHSKEREAAVKKTSSALLSAQQRQDYEVEQLMRRFQAIKLALTRAHAAQRLNLQQSLVKSLGIKKPTKLLGLPSFNSSLAETRGLVPQQPAHDQCFDSIAACAGTGRCCSPASLADSASPLSRSRCRSPVESSHTDAERSPSRISAIDYARCRSPVSSMKSSKSTAVLCNPERTMHYDPYEHRAAAVAGRLSSWHTGNCSSVKAPRRQAAFANAAMAAAGQLEGLAIMPPLRPASRKAGVLQTSAVKSRKPPQNPPTATGNGCRQLSWVGSPVTSKRTSDAQVAVADCRIPAETTYGPNSASTGLPSIGEPARLPAAQGALTTVESPTGVAADKHFCHSDMLPEGAGVRSSYTGRQSQDSTSYLGGNGPGVIRPTTRHDSRTALPITAAAVDEESRLLSRPEVSAGRPDALDWVHRSSNSSAAAQLNSTTETAAVLEHSSSGQAENTAQQQTMGAPDRLRHCQHPPNLGEAQEQHMEGRAYDPCDIGHENDSSDLPYLAASNSRICRPAMQPDDLQLGYSKDAEAADCLPPGSLPACPEQQHDTKQRVGQQAADAAVAGGPLLLQVLKQENSRTAGSNTAMHSVADWNVVKVETASASIPQMAAGTLPEESQVEPDDPLITSTTEDGTNQARSGNHSGEEIEEPAGSSGPLADDDSISKPVYSMVEQTTLQSEADTGEAEVHTLDSVQGLDDSCTGSAQVPPPQPVADQHMVAEEAPDDGLTAEGEFATLKQLPLAHAGLADCPSLSAVIQVSEAAGVIEYQTIDGMVQDDHTADSRRQSDREQLLPVDQQHQKAHNAEPTTDDCHSENIVSGSCAVPIQP